jgi:hypothetical protein
MTASPHALTPNVFFCQFRLVAFSFPQGKFSKIVVI